MMRIQQLPVTVANQIAAGEVIERPASVVKELLENSLDAQADIISIDIGYGGLNQIKITDNGIGIVAEDLPLAIAAHATSKIKQLSDLYSIASMGFRGEALASIASISRLTISSRPESQEHAMMLASDGHAIHMTPCARNQGTTVDVRDIFFNAPVRKKFLKTEQSEFQAIETVVKRFALSAPAIALNLTHNGKQRLNLPAAHCAQTRLQRIRKLLGKTFIEQAIYLDVEHAGMRLHGWVSNSEYQSSQSDKQWVYVNARMVKDKLLNHAIKRAYESLLYPGRYPACLLYLTLNPAEVDVNVHPTKHEVRFQQPRLVHDFITSQIQQALAVPRTSCGYQQSSVKEITTGQQIHENYLSLPLSIKKIEQSAVVTSHWITLNNAYALIFLQEQPYLVDIEKLQRHWLLSILAQESLPLASRPLLVPISYPVKEFSPDRINHYRQALNQVGVELGLAGENAMLVRSLPIAVPHLDIKRFLALVFKLNSPTNQQLIELLSLCQLFNAYQALPEETETLSAYLQTLYNAKELPVWCRQLSTTLCESLLNA
ncbi:DNA mismatch repair endonuclease MutL [Legionella feeleii]|uniref:DNA mismatch repair protein MutL n=1 Tax=Legionella feeleii TaxID=453 RepID=A0A0W0THH5_9GAMM|nr:DNA mismatch repair endonuclease MutL [Legionella feeleii]KTC95044.1 DNA mismatch repair protein MutL [Legionella feeleii]SPX61738.1 DNA mismatch repair protein MutL [Legionella feeleii]